MKTLYAVLGVEPDADQGDLENAFLRLKARYPQAKLEADENLRIQFQGISQAYKTLSNPDTRAAYDKRLASVGVRNVSASATADDGGWMSTRNFVVAGVVVLLVACMWFYNQREQTRIQKDIAERAMRLAEEEKKRQDEQREADEQRRQAMANASQQRQDEQRERQLRAEAAASIRDAQYQSRQAESQAMAAQRQQQYEQQNRERQEQADKQRAAYEAERRLQNEKQQLRNMCMQRYNRPDC
jgi:curved DNA-binding protein CbpA